MKLFICGPARHGKDSVAEIIKRKYGLTHESSSHFCMRHFLRKELDERYGLAYTSEEECFEDRYNHRKRWYDIICDYNRNDPARLSREIFEAYDIYVGIRDREEFLVAKEISDLAIWVDARPRLDLSEGERQFADKLIQESDCDVTLKNDRGYGDLEYKIDRLFNNLIT